MDSNAENNGGDAITGTAEVAEFGDAARSLGLRRVSAWVKDEGTLNRNSTGAERTRRSRQNALTAGVGQVSVALPVELHSLVRTLATRTRAGESAEAVLNELLRQRGASTSPLGTGSVADRLGLSHLSLWRRLLILAALPSAYKRPQA